MHTSPNLSVLWCHGRTDLEVPISYADDAISFLRSSVGIPNNKLHYRTYKGLAHSINDDELDDLARWLRNIFG